MLALRTLSPLNIWLFLAFIVVAANAHSKILLDADKLDSIAHFRAFAPTIEDDQKLPLTLFVTTDTQGYVWFSVDPNILRYDGYQIKTYSLDSFGDPGSCYIPFVFKDVDDVMWAGNCALHRYNSQEDNFDTFNITGGRDIRSIVDNGEGSLWLGGDSLLSLFNKESMSITYSAQIDTDLVILSLAYDRERAELWLTSTQGVFRFDTRSKQLIKIKTPLDGQFQNFRLRDTTLDTQNKELWVATPKGLLKVNTLDESVKRYLPTDSVNSLPTQDTTTTAMDSAGNIWIGLEKEGVCLYRRKRDDFTCLRSAFGKNLKVPVATIEDIHEDDRGSIWMAVNNYGAIRITPDLEKFRVLKDSFSNRVDEYFANTTDGVALDNGELWFATDGGGINIFDRKTGQLRNIRHDPKNKNSLPTNSVISLDQDHEGYIWASFWAGGISRIDPRTMTFNNYTANDDQQDGRSGLVNDNTFVVKADQRGGVWISVWDYGLQYFDGNNERFYDYSSRKYEGGVVNGGIEQIEVFENEVWVVGVSGLEKLDLKSGFATTVLKGPSYALTSIYFNSPDEVYLGSRSGLIRYNLLTKEEHRYTTEHGLSDDNVYYLTKDQFGKLWVATGNGISVFDESTESFKRFYQKDGLVGNNMNAFGKFLHVEDMLFTNAKTGVNVINPSDLPDNTLAPKTIISHVHIIAEEQRKHTLISKDIKGLNDPEIRYKNNALDFTFVGLSYIFPERTRYRYRLLGWKEVFTEVGASERVARYTNLKPGAYSFEVYSANDNGVWDTKGDRFSFTILAPWYATWWAIILFLMLGVSIIYALAQLRLAAKIQSEKELSAKVEAELSAKVKEKTSQLEQQAIELKETGKSLAKLNAELEERVEHRTEELQVEINERKLAESKLFHMAFHDSLTGLPNRQWLIKRIKKALQCCSQSKGYRFCLMMLDGDRFKQINDTHGHIVGDQLLVSAAARLSELLSGKQYATRLGGDEFTVLAEELENTEEMERLAASIVKAFQAPFCLDSHEIYFHMSIGLTICDERYTSVPSVMRDADIAMYFVKDKEKGNFKIFDKEMRNENQSMAELESDLHKAIEEKQLFLVYQPLINLDTNRVSGFEALVRWRHPKRGLVLPYDFISLAEETGLIWDVGAYVLDEACRQVCEWHNMWLNLGLDSDEKPTISVNVSTGQFRRRDFLALVDETIERHGMDSSYLKLEITESVLMENNKVIRTLIDELYLRKIDLAIDDFGTGYSSLAYLNEIPVQQIKIDKKFIDAIDCTASGGTNEDALAIVKATIGLGRSLRKVVTAEGIESRQQLDALREFGCDFAQGYYIAKPLVPEDAEKLLSVHFEDNKENRKLTRDDLLTRYKNALSSRKPRLRDKRPQGQ